MPCRNIESPADGRWRALSAKRGETKVSELKGASKSMYESMSEEQLEEFAETDRKGLPDKKDGRE